MKNSIVVMIRQRDRAPRLEELRQDWAVFEVDHPAACWQILGQRPHDVLLTDWPVENGGLEFFQQLAARFPKVVRIRAYAPEDRQRSYPGNGSVHQYVPYDCTEAFLLLAIQRARLINGWLMDASIHRLLGQLTRLPCLPAFYLRLLHRLQSPDATTEEIGEVIAEDPVVTAKLLQMVNSAFFGLANPVTCPGGAVSYLGVERVRALVMMIHTFTASEANAPAAVSHAWRESLSHHSLMVAQLAAAISRKEAVEAKSAELAFTGGILHDLGKLMLALNCPENCERALYQARAQHSTLHAAERDIFGLSHAELGACILGIWGLPLEIIEAIAYHHEPQLHFWDAFGPVAAVHAANALVHEVHPPTNGEAPQTVDSRYLERLQCLDQLNEWRELGRTITMQRDSDPAG